MKNLLLLILLTLPFVSANAQKKIDSIAYSYGSRLDTISFSDSENDELINQLLDSLKIRSGKGENFYASSLYYGKLGRKFYYSSNYHRAGEYFDSAAHYSLLNEDTLMSFKLTMNAGALRYIEGDYANALSRYLDAVEFGKLSAESELGRLYSNIGMLYNSIDMLDKAQDYLTLSLENYRKYNADSSSLIKPLNVLGMIARKQGLLEESLMMLKRAEKVAIAEKQYLDAGDINHNLFETYKKVNDVDKQLFHLSRSISFYDSTGFENKVYAEKGELASFYLSQNKISEAGRLLNEIFDRYNDLNFENSVKQMLNYEYSTYLHEIGESQKAYKFLKRSLAYKDSVHDQSQLNETANLELRLRMKQKAQIDSIQHAEDEERRALLAEKKEAEFQAELSSQKLISIVGFGGGAFALIFVFILYKANRTKSRANQVISKQKNEIEEKQQEIIDSIQYSQRLQQAIMPEIDEFKRNFPNSFIFYKPKDIVAGDFYFLEKVEDDSTSKVYFAAVDCTGHGVPGAMLSIVGANGLKRCIRELKLRDPGEILTELSSIVAENFTSSKEKIRDGMDIALCCIELKGSAKQLHFAGAHNPAWIINPNRATWPENTKVFREGDGVMLSPDKHAVGYKEKKVFYRTTSIELVEGDKIYLFSDGYADQFGGDRGKKMKSAVFRRFLVEINEKSMQDQEQLIRKNFEEWKNNYEQVDDVCVIGVRV
tara:strand:- start:66473 stop:68608 length:2136 start_codon:yes stop_codon:yes gene_type:complete